MRAEILLSLLFTKATFGAVANYQTWMASGNWNPADVAALLGLNSMVIQKQFGDSHGVAESLVAPIKSSDLREQGKAVDAAIARGVSYGLGPQPGPICIAEAHLPEGSEAISDAYLAADHIFELQFASKILNKQGIELNRIKGKLQNFKDKLNTGPNVAMISSELNCYKAVVMKRTIEAVLGPNPNSCPPYDATQPSNVELTAYMSFFCKQLLGAAEAVDSVTSKRKRGGDDDEEEPESEEARFALQRLLKCINVDLDRLEIPGDEHEVGRVEWTCMDQVKHC